MSTVQKLLGKKIAETLQILKIDHEKQLIALSDGTNNYAISFKHALESENLIQVNEEETTMTCATWRRAGDSSPYLRTDKANAKLDINAFLEGL